MGYKKVEEGVLESKMCAVEIGIYFGWMRGPVPIFGPGGDVATLSFEFGTKHAERTV